MLGSKINFLKGSDRLLTKSQLQSLDYTDKGKPFCQIVSKTQDTINLDVVENGQVFVGAK